MNSKSSAVEALDFDLTDKRSLGAQLIPRLARIRETQPVFWSDAQRGWFVTRYADVMQAFEGKLPLSSNRLGKVAFAAIPEEEWPARIPLLTCAAPNFSNMTDPPDHGRLRKPLNLAFSKAKVESLAGLRADVYRRIAGSSRKNGSTGIHRDDFKTADRQRHHAADGVR